MEKLIETIKPLTVINVNYTNETFGVKRVQQHRSMEFVYVVDGELTMDYYLSDNKKTKQFVSVLPNQLLIIKPMIAHFQYIPKQAHLFVLELSYKDSYKYFLDSYFLKDNFVNTLPPIIEFLKSSNPILILNDHGNICDSFLTLLKLLFNHYSTISSETEFFDAKYEVDLKNFLIEVAKCITHSKKYISYNRYVSLALSDINNNYYDEISASSVAQKLNISESYLRTIFKKSVGVSFYQYLLNYRMEKAKTLLSSQNIPISLVAKKVGYNNLKSFEIAFFKYEKISPTQFRNIQKQKGFILWKDHQNNKTIEEFIIDLQIDDE